MVMITSIKIVADYAIQSLRLTLFGRIFNVVWTIIFNRMGKYLFAFQYMFGTLG